MLKEKINAIDFDISFDDDALFLLSYDSDTVSGVATSKQILLNINEFKDLLRRVENWIEKIELNHSPRLQRVAKLDKFNITQKSNNDLDMILDMGNLKVKHNYIAGTDSVEIKTRSSFLLSWADFKVFIKLQYRFINFINEEF